MSAAPCLIDDCRPPSCCFRQAIFSSNPANIATNSPPFFIVNCISAIFVAYNTFTSVNTGAQGSADIFSSICMLGGQPITTERGRDVAFTLSPLHQGMYPPSPAALCKVLWVAYIMASISKVPAQNLTDSKSAVRTTSLCCPLDGIHPCPSDSWPHALHVRGQEMMKELCF